MNHAPRLRRSRILLLLLGLAALALSSATSARAFRCECAPLGGEFCGANGVTYDSPCVAHCFGVKIVHSGPC
ncbi:MAG: hypothetical protein JF614_26970 [Acidobacteria bacterium]|nr:hypothetical protein [Acidobacteriota bacterium]